MFYSEHLLIRLISPETNLTRISYMAVCLCKSLIQLFKICFYNWTNLLNTGMYTHNGGMYQSFLLPNGSMYQPFLFIQYFIILLCYADRCSLSIQKSIKV